MSKEQSIRDTAYAIWEAEGRPDGCAEHHWERAASQVEAQVSSSASQGGSVESSAAEAEPRVAAGAAPKKTRTRK
jgi:hypothetical protein